MLHLFFSLRHLPLDRGFDHFSSRCFFHRRMEQWIGFFQQLINWYHRLEFEDQMEALLSACYLYCRVSLRSGRSAQCFDAESPSLRCVESLFDVGNSDAPVECFCHLIFECRRSAGLAQFLR
jgi:hypothetical protein